MLFIYILFLKKNKFLELDSIYRDVFKVDKDMVVRLLYDFLVRFGKRKKYYIRLEGRL